MQKNWKMHNLGGVKASGAVRHISLRGMAALGLKGLSCGITGNSYTVPHCAMNAAAHPHQENVRPLVPNLARLSFEAK
jgi:hypothetical protein